MRKLDEQDLQTLLQSDENYYNSKRSNNQSFQTFLRILIVAFLGVFIANTPWSSLHSPILAYTAVGALLIVILLNIYTFSKVQNALEQVRDLTHKLYDDPKITYINEIQKVEKSQNRRSDFFMICLAISIIICPISYIVEQTHRPEEATQMAKKQQSTQQPNKEVGGQRGKRTWDTPSTPITPTDMPANPVGAPAESTTPEQSTDPPVQPTPKPADTPEKPQPRDKK